RIQNLHVTRLSLDRAELPTYIVSLRACGAHLLPARPVPRSGNMSTMENVPLLVRGLRLGVLPVSPRLSSSYAAELTRYQKRPLATLNRRVAAISELHEQIHFDSLTLTP